MRGFLKVASVAFAGATLMTATTAFAANCNPSCANVTGSLKPTAIFPAPDDFRLRGDLFSQQPFSLGLAGNLSQQVNLGFSFRIGGQSYNSLFVNENGIVSFGSALSSLAGPPVSAPQQQTATAAATYMPVGSLRDFGVPVIAPFYADLVANQVPGRYVGDVTVQFGFADPYANGGSYRTEDLQQAVRITWYGLSVLNAAGAPAPVYAQLLLAGDGRGTNSFEFRYGPPDSPGQAGYGSIAGFALGDDFYQFSGPYNDSTATYFELDNGRLVGPLGAGVPEPATWLMMLVGFFATAIMRRRDSRVGVRAAA